MGRASGRKKMLSREQRGTGRGHGERRLLTMADLMAIDAHHEAGHTVVGLALECPVRSVWLDPSGRRVPGLRAYSDLGVPPWAQQWESMLLDSRALSADQARFAYVCLVTGCAGMLAEDRFCVESGTPQPHDPVSDRAKNADMVRLLAMGSHPDAEGDTFAAFYGETFDTVCRTIHAAATVCADHILTLNWAVVERISSTLLCRSDMSGDQIATVVARAGGIHAQPIVLPPTLAARYAHVTQHT